MNMQVNMISNVLLSSPTLVYPKMAQLRLDSNLTGCPFCMLLYYISYTPIALVFSNIALIFLACALGPTSRAEERKRS